MKSYVFTLLFIFGAYFSALCYNVSGRVIDQENEPLIKATVRMLNAKDSTAVKAVITNMAGEFTLSDVPKGKYLLEATYIGFETAYKPITLQKGSLNVGDISLRENAALLKDVTVTGIKTPIRVATDTVEFNADSYRTQPNAVVEDLLKRLPGVEVSSDGSITANGKSVTKILVDGKEFFSDDPKVASKNLPVNMIDKLQVVDRKSDLARLTGVDDGEEETVINLTVKKGMKNGWFGNVEAGYGTDERYNANFTVNRFWDGNQVTFIGGMNNINDMRFTDGGRRFRRFGGSNGITTSQSFGVNFNVGNEEIFRVGGDVLYSHTRTNSWNKSSTEYLLNNGSRWQDNEKSSLDRGHNLRADFRIEWKPDSFNTLDIRPNISYNINDSESNETGQVANGSLTSLTNKSYNVQKSHGNSFEMGANVIYNHNFKQHRGRSFSIQGQIRTSNVHEKENAYSWIKYYLENDSIDEYDQFITNHTWSNTLSSRVSWTEPLGDPKKGHYLTLSYNIQYRWNNADKLTYDRQLPSDMMDVSNIAALTDIYDMPLWTWDLLPTDVMLDSLSNRFRNDYMNQDIRVGYRYVSSTHNLNVGISLVPQMSKSIDLINDDKSIPRRNVLNFAPFLRYRYKMNKTRSFNMNYRGRSSQPSMTQLQPVADMSDPLNIIQGNPNLDPSFSHNIMLRLQDFNQDAQRSLMLMANASLTQNSIISKTLFTDNGGRLTTYENVNGVWNARLFSMFSMPLKRKTFTINNFLSFSYDRSVGYNNGERNNAGNLGFSEGFGIAFRPDNLELEIRPEYRLQYTTNSLASATDKTVHTYGGSFNGTYYTPFGLVLATDLRYSANKGYGEGYNKNEWMWNASISYQTLRDKSLTFTLSGHDLLNQVSNVSRTVTGNYIKDSMFNSLTRYFMVSVSYKFNTFKGNEMPEDRNNPFREFGPPPGGSRPGGNGGGGRPPMR